MMTMTNSTPIMSTKAENGDQNRAPGGVGGDQPRTLGPVDQTRNIGPGDQTRTPTLKDLPHTILAAKPCPIALPTQPTLGPHRPLIEEIRPNPIESPAVGKYLLMYTLCPTLKVFLTILNIFLAVLEFNRSTTKVSICLIKW